MSNPKGNPGNKGGGRKSAYQEKADAERLWKIWTTPGINEEIQARIAAGKESLEDIFISLGFQGNERSLTAVFKKLFPDKAELTGKDGAPITIKWDA